MKKYFAFLLCSLIMAAFWAQSCSDDPKPDPCEANPTPDCPNYVDPCEVDPTPDCPNYVDPCEENPTPDCPRCLENPDPDCPNYVDPCDENPTPDCPRCLEDPDPDCPNYDPCEKNPTPGCHNYEDQTPVLGNSITIGTVAYTVADKKVEKIDDGVWYLYAHVTDARKPLKIHSVRYTTGMSGYGVETWIGRDTLTGKEAPLTMVNRYESRGRQVRTAINGGFYGLAAGAGPMGHQHMNGVTVFAPDDGAEKPLPVIGFDNLNRPYIDFVKTNSKVTISKNSSEYKITTVNGCDPVYNTGGRWEDYLVLYNSHNGKNTRTNQWGMEVLCYPADGTEWESLENYANVRCKVEKVTPYNGVTRNSTAIPKGKFVLSGNSKAQQFLSVLQPGDEVIVNLDYYLQNSPDVNFTTLRNVIAGWNIILSNNNILDWYNNSGGNSGLESGNNPRTGVGYTDNKFHVFFTVVEGRNPTSGNPTVSAGVSTKELAQVMQYFGAAHAINLDGGGSSCIMVDKTTKNFLSDGSQRSVCDGLAIIKK
jgi:hypothetical protein